MKVGDLLPWKIAAWVNRHDFVLRTVILTFLGVVAFAGLVAGVWLIQDAITRP